LNYGSVGRVGRRAKIICTLGPAVASDQQLLQLVERGMDAARLNLSFGTRDEHVEWIRRVRAAAKAASRTVGVILDLPGPKLRVGPLEGGRLTLERGARVRFVALGSPAAARDLPRVPVGKRFFHDALIRGDQVLLGDGVVELVIAEVGDEEAVGEVVHGGEVGQHMAVHLPGMPLRQAPPWDEDLPHIDLAVEQQADFLALTYVRDGADLVAMREHLEQRKVDIPLIAKIERSEAFARLDGILGRADAVMIRRSDLGADIALTRIPLVQKEVVRLANNRGVPVIISTQMLGSMIHNPRPTRAEASDVFNAVADGADGVMLSAETATGKHPQQALEMMDRLVLAAERETFVRDRTHELISYPSPFPDVTARIAVRAAAEAEAKLIVCFTESGRTAGLVAKYRSQAPVIAFCHDEVVQRRLVLHWGVEYDALEPLKDVEEMVARVDRRLIETGAARLKDRIIIIYGAPVGEMGHTNSVRLHEVGSKD
jgi:pyruvate kinase